jgi:hypothetical protein
VFPGLLEIGTTAGTIERDLALFIATLGADAAMQRRAKALLSSNLADGTTQNPDSSGHYGIEKPEAARDPARLRIHLRNVCFLTSREACKRAI